MSVCVCNFVSLCLSQCVCVCVRVCKSLSLKLLYTWCRCCAASACARSPSAYTCCSPFLSPSASAFACCLHLLSLLAAAAFARPYKNDVALAVVVDASCLCLCPLPSLCLSLTLSCSPLCQRILFCLERVYVCACVFGGVCAARTCLMRHVSCYLSTATTASACVLLCFCLWPSPGSAACVLHFKVARSL